MGSTSYRTGARNGLPGQPQSRGTTVQYLAIHKVFGWTGAKRPSLTPKGSNLGANPSEYFMNRLKYHTHTPT